MLTTRAVGPDDLELICRHREQMFRESNAPGRTEDVLRLQTAHFRPWLARHLAQESYLGFVVEDEGRAVAGIGFMLLDWPPGPSHPTEDRRGIVLNVFVEPSHRKRGIAEELMRMAEEEFARRGVAYLMLHATAMGRPLYERMGWGATNEMAKSLARQVRA